MTTGRVVAWNYRQWKLWAVKITGIVPCLRGRGYWGRVRSILLLQDLLQWTSYSLHRKAKSPAWPPGRVSPARRAPPTDVCPLAGQAVLRLHRPLPPHPPRPRPSPNYQQCPHRSRPSLMPPSTPRRSSSDPNQISTQTLSEELCKNFHCASLPCLPLYIRPSKDCYCNTMEMTPSGVPLYLTQLFHLTWFLFLFMTEMFLKNFLCNFCFLLGHLMFPIHLVYQRLVITYSNVQPFFFVGFICARPAVYFSSGSVRLQPCVGRCVSVEAYLQFQSLFIEAFF